MIAILKYNAGNVTSVENAVRKLGYSTVISDDIEVLQAADKVIFPGVGEASSAMDYLKEKGLDQVIMNLKQPVLGICLGMQLMCEFSEEGETEGLGIFDTKVLKFVRKPLPLRIIFCLLVRLYKRIIFMPRNFIPKSQLKLDYKF